MPLYTYDGNYTSMSGWMWYTDNLDMVDEGWKLHVSGDAGNGQTILNAVLPVLQKGKYPHKFLKSTDDTANQTGLQAGKFLAVYPSNIVEAFIIVGAIDHALLNIGIGHHDCPCILKEKWVGHTVIYTRYGAFSGSLYHPTSDRYVDDTIGGLKPDWIEDPWSLYSPAPDLVAISRLKSWPIHSKKGHRRRGR